MFVSLDKVVTGSALHFPTMVVASSTMTSKHVPQKRSVQARPVNGYHRKRTNFRAHNISSAKFSRGLIFVGKRSPT